jgi:maltoporin
MVRPDRTGLPLLPLLLMLLTAGTAMAAPPTSTKAESAPPTEAASSRLLKLLEGFHFGTYGRVGYSSDLREGSAGRSVNVVSHGPRLEEPPYAELDLGYSLQRPDALSFKVLFTLGLLEDLFHYTGEFDLKLAVRNLYAEATHVLTPHLSLWVGSRMYRGDDIYLLDFWPLDNLNTLGGGVGLRFGGTRIKLHAGVNRLDDPFQYQRIAVTGPRFGTQEVEVLDRQRTILSLKVIQELPKLLGDLSLKVAGYAEVHLLPDGERRDAQLNVEQLPEDTGWVVGLQLGLWGLGQNGFVNLWARAAGGLGAYGDLTVPHGLGLDKRAADAREALLALSANVEWSWLGVMFGAYLRYFEDADTNVSDPDDAWEGVAVVRPHLFLHRYFHQVFEASIQVRRPDGLDPRTQSHLVPAAFKFSLMPTLSWDRGSYSRPQLRVIYTVSYLDEGARLSYAEDDPRYGVAVHHFLGAQVEWWFNSSYR